MFSKRYKNLTALKGGVLNPTANKVDTANFFEEGFMTNGVYGVLNAAALLTFATGGAGIIVNLSAEAKKPVRDIPLALVVSTLSVAVLYSVLAYVAGGVLPLDQVAGKPLTVTAEAILPKALFMFFIVGGAMFALASTLNSQLASASKPLLQMSVDGWLPRKLAYIHPQFKTPMVWISLFFLAGFFPIVTGISISRVGSLVNVSNNIGFIMLGIFSLRLPKIFPEQWARSKFKVPYPALVAFCVLSVAGSILTISLSWRNLTPGLMIANVVMVVVAIGYCFLRKKAGKVHQELSWENA